MISWDAFWALPNDEARKDALAYISGAMMGLGGLGWAQVTVTEGCLFAESIQREIATALDEMRNTDGQA